MSKKCLDIWDWNSSNFIVLAESLKGYVDININVY
jgi:hypothetical protein